MLPTEAVPTAPGSFRGGGGGVARENPAVPGDREDAKAERSPIWKRRAKAERAAEAERVLAEKEAEEEVGGGQLEPVTSDEAKRSARKRGGAQDRKRHRLTPRTGRAKPRAGEQSVRKTSGDKTHINTPRRIVS
jgi:hypothetical protein